MKQLQDIFNCFNELFKKHVITGSIHEVFFFDAFNDSGEKILSCLIAAAGVFLFSNIKYFVFCQ